MKHMGNLLDILLERLNGIEPGSLKGTVPYQLWVKEEGEKEREAFCVAFKEAEEPARSHAGREATHLAALFAQLPQEVQDGYRTQITEEKEKALEERGQMRQLLNKPLAPKEAQEMIDQFGQMVSPFLDQVAKLMGMKILMVIGGTEPRRAGKLNMLVHNHGTDKQAIPQKFDGNEAWYSQCLEAFGEFLAECYDVEDKKVDLTDGLLCLEEDVSDDEIEGEVPAKKQSQKGKGVQKASKKLELSKRKRGAEESEGALKQKKKSKISGVRGQAAFIESSGAPRGKKKAETVTKKVAASIGKSLVNVVVTAMASQEHAEGTEENGGGGWNSLFTTRMMLTIARACVRDSSFTTTPTHQSTCRRVGNTVTPAHLVIDPLLLGMGGPPSLDAPSPLKDTASNQPSLEKGLMSFGRIPIFGPSDMLNPFEGTNTALLDEARWPPWFVKAHETLLSPLLSSLGDSWDSVLWYWTVIEVWQEFVTGRISLCPAASEKAQLRPPEVDWLQKCSCCLNDNPDLGQKDLRTLGDAWWTWWKALQPDWHGVENVIGPLEPRHTMGEGNWGVLWHPGMNGLFTVLICLKWWGEAMTGHYGMGSM
ncbi:uncharacterized protein ARMOST_06241 [Armillaria ostoyae]|uniref:Uncharacterized protein n=1 Tax=Armillaria ostoyae TaxID=47428 RepID=A0A284R2G3_ARMOS|nr:uncharacterized protein ARMOST_06241 [Armillaria ostoyae]